MFHLFQQQVKNQVTSLLEVEESREPRKKKIKDSSVKLLSANEFL
tara:strand:+ start:180 stop:314 length:135 start_codon:yes stop_codon:yes gene_type:complete